MFLNEALKIYVLSCINDPLQYPVRNRIFILSNNWAVYIGKFWLESIAVTFSTYLM